MYPFGFRRPPITFKQLLYNLEHRCDCRVVLQDEGGIQDTKGDESGAVYLVERFCPKTKQILFYFVEVYVMALPVLPEYLTSICTALDLPEERVAPDLPN